MHALWDGSDHTDLVAGSGIPSATIVASGAYPALCYGWLGGSRVLGQASGMSSTTGMIRVVICSYSANPWYLPACSA